MRRGRGAQLFPIHANDLLIARDDARLHDRSETCILDRRCGIDLLFGQKLTKLTAAAVGTEHADNGDFANESAKIPRNIRRAAGIKALAGNFDDWHRRLRRNTADLAPDEFIQHKIADDEKAFRLGPLQNFV